MKRDGSLQEFNKGKIIDVVVHAGAAYQDAVILADNVERWVPSVAIDGVVDHNQIRTKVLEFLTALDPKVAQNYESYRK
jgi:hypothetical protein